MWSRVKMVIAYRYGWLRPFDEVHRVGENASPREWMNPSAKVSPIRVYVSSTMCKCSRRLYCIRKSWFYNSFLVSKWMNIEVTKVRALHDAQLYLAQHHLPLSMYQPSDEAGAFVLLVIVKINSYFEILRDVRVKHDDASMRNKSCIRLKTS